MDRYRRTVGHEEQSSCKRSSSLVPSHARRKKKSRLLAAGNFDVRADVRSGTLDTHLKGNLSEADLQAFGFVDKHYITSADADITLRSDMKKYYAVRWKCG